MQDPINFFNIEYLFQVIYLLLTGRGDFSVLVPFWNTYIIIAYILSTFFIIGATYSHIRLDQIRKREKESLESLTEKAISKQQSPTNERWQKVLLHLESQNENDWRLAVIESDVMLDEMMTKMGYIQETLGDKLKSVEKSDFSTIDKAWEAHKLRNNIAHAGSDFLLSQHEARRTINLYKDVFQEFEYI